MGVQGLWQVLEPVGKPVALETLENKVLGVDVSLWLHQAVKGMRDAQGQPVGNAHLVVLLQRVCKLLFYRIKPVFVFDGGVPQLKKQTLASRQQRHAEALEEAQRRRARRALLAHAQKRLRGGAPPPLLPKSPKKSPKKPALKAGPASALADLYELPPLPAPVDTLDSDEEDDRSRTSVHIDVPDSVDVESEDFASLPADVRCDVLAALHERHRYGSRDRSLPKDSESFSSYQMSRLLKKRTLKEKLEDARRDLTQLRSQQWIAREEEQEGKEAQVWRVASENDTHQILLSKGHTTGGSDANSELPGSSGSPRAKPDDEVPVQPSWTRLREGRPSSVQRDVSTASEKPPKSRSSSRTVTDVLVPDESDESTASDEEKEPERQIPKQLGSVNPVPTECRKSLREQEHSLLEPTTSPESLKEFKNCGSREPSTEYVNIPSEVVQKPIVVLCKSMVDKKTSFEHQVEMVKEKTVTEPKNLEGSECKAVIDVSDTVDTRKPVLTAPEERRSSGQEMDEVIRSQQKSNKVSEMNTRVPDSFEQKGSPMQCSEPLPEQKSSRSVAEIEACYDLTSDTEYTDKFHSQTESNNDSNAIREEVSKEGLEEDSDDDGAGRAESEADANGIVVQVERAGVPTDDMFADVFAMETEQQRQRREELSERLEESGRRMEVEAGRLELQAAQLSQQMAAECQELLRLLGLPYVVSPEEAEAQCAQLELLGLTQGTITDDSDVWLFGGTSVYKHFFQREKFVEHFALRDIVAHFGLDRQKLIAFALLSGSDYTTGVRGVGPVTAMEILSEFGAQEALAILQAFREWLEKAKSNQALPGTTTRSHLQRLQLEPGFPSSTVVQAYLSPAVDTSRERFSWGLPDLDALRTFGTEKLGWSREKMDNLLLPVLKRLQEKQSQSRIDNYFTVEVTKREQLFPSKRLRRAAKKVAKKAAKRPAPQELELSEESD